MTVSKVFNNVGLEVQNSVNTVIDPRATVMKFTGAGVSVALVGGKSVVTITGGGGPPAGTANTVAVFDGAGALSDDTTFFNYYKPSHFQSLRTYSIPNVNFRPTSSVLIGTTFGAFPSLISTPVGCLFVGTIGSMTFGAASQYTQNIIVNNIGFTTTLGASASLDGCILNASNIQLGDFTGLSYSIILGQFKLTKNYGAITASASVMINPNGGVDTEVLDQAAIFGEGNSIFTIGDAANVLACFGSGNVLTGGGGFHIAEARIFGSSNTITSVLQSIERIDIFGNDNTCVPVVETINSLLIYGNSNDVKVDTTYVYGLGWDSLNLNTGGVGVYFGVGMYPSTDRANFLFQIGNGTSGIDLSSSFGIRRNNKSVETNITNLSVNTPAAIIAGATITPLKSIEDISSAGAVSLSVVTAITNGVNNGQLLKLRNVGAFNITVPAGANTRQSGGTNAVLTPGSTISYTWSSVLVDWLEESRTIV